LVRARIICHFQDYDSPIKSEEASMNAKEAKKKKLTRDIQCHELLDCAEPMRFLKGIRA